MGNGRVRMASAARSRAYNPGDFTDSETEDDMDGEMNPALRNIPFGAMDVAGSSKPVDFIWLALVALYRNNPDVIGKFDIVPTNLIHPPDFTTTWTKIFSHDQYTVALKKTWLVRSSRVFRPNVYYICIIQKASNEVVWECAFMLNRPALF